MKRKTAKCGLCEKSDLASICAPCADSRLNDYRNSLKTLKNIRDSRYSRLTAELVTKSKADDQLTWRVHQNEKLARLREKLKWTEKQLLQGKAKLDERSKALEVKYALLKSAWLTLQQNRVEQLDKIYPNQISIQRKGLMASTTERLHKQSVVIKNICRLFPQRRVIVDGDRKDGSNGQYDTVCNARLPRGLDPHSVPSEELAASLGYMVQLLNLVVLNLAAPALHNSGFAGSCSRIWQRDSYWDAHPSSRSNEFPLFIPRQNSCTSGGENSWSDRNSSSFGVASIESEKKPSLDSTGSCSFNCYSASPHSVETHKDLQKGISLLKKSVACITAYCYNTLCLDAPSEASTFEAFAKLLGTLSSFQEGRPFFPSSSRSHKQVQVQQLNKSDFLVGSGMSSKSLLESAHATSMKRNAHDNNLSNSADSFLYSNELSNIGKLESLVEGWDLVEHPTLPPPPSQSEDVEHWTRAMFLDATKR